MTLTLFYDCPKLLLYSFISVRQESAQAFSRLNMKEENLMDEHSRRNFDGLENGKEKQISWTD